MLDITTTNTLINVGVSSLSTIAGTLLASLLLRGNKKTEELEKIKAGKFSEALDIMVQDGKLSYLELYKCNNFFKIAKKADEYHKEKEYNHENSQPFDLDWFVRFFNAAGNVSNENMQELWARIFSGEVCNPGSFSLKAIETLYNMTQTEALLFQRAASLLLNEFDGSKIIYRSEYEDFGPSNLDINARYGLGAKEFAVLEECGLLSSIPQESYATVCEGNAGVYTENIILLFQINNELDYPRGREPTLNYNSYMLTQTALQLLPIIQAKPDENYIIELGKHLKNRNPEFIITAHKILSFDNDGKIHCNIAEDLLLESNI